MFVITGGGSGIGRALALALAKQDQPVLIIGRREALLKETAAHSSLIDYLVADVSTEEGLNLIQDHLKEVPKITALINNAAILLPVSLNDMKRTQWDHILSTNLTAPLFLTQKLHKQLNQGRVLNMGTGAAYLAIKGWSTYCVSKAALALLTRCWQVDSPTVSFTSMMPGLVDTEMQTVARECTFDPEQTRFYEDLKNKNLLITPETVAEFMLWLLLHTDDATFASKEWDIYDKSHHVAWLKAPHQVLHWES